MNKIKDINVGDIVRVKDWGKGYSCNNQWFNNHFDELNHDWIINYAYDNNKYDKYWEYNSDPNHYKVLYIGYIEFHNNYKQPVALISEYFGDTEFGDVYVESVYLIGLDALDVVEHIKQMTKAEIEKELGYKIEIINKKNESEE